MGQPFHDPPEHDNESIRRAEERAAELERYWKQAEEEKKNLEERLAEVERKTEETQQEARKIKEDEEATRVRINNFLREGNEPEIWPSTEDIKAAKERIEYDRSMFHLAICGSAGSGKSSLINSLRGMHSKSRGCAKTGIVETTREIGRYPDNSKLLSRNRFVWYDIPGAGTQDIKGWQYFNDQGLYVFDFIIILIDNRFQKIDIEILKNCRRHGVPSFIVRSKSDQHIANIMQERETADDTPDEDEEDEEGNGTDPNQNNRFAYRTPKEQYIQQTRENVANELAKAELPPQDVYLISKDVIYRMIKSNSFLKMFEELTLGSSEYAIDEKGLIQDMMKAAAARRYQTLVYH